MTSALDQLHRKARKLAVGQIDDDEEVVTVIPGRSRQAMIVTDRGIVIVKPGIMAGAWIGPKATWFRLARITAINVHSGRGVAALELVIDGKPRDVKADLTTAFQMPNWLPCQPSVGSSSLIGELRAFVQSDGRSRSARAELSGFGGE
jgi:hypothetical protein